MAVGETWLSRVYKELERIEDGFTSTFGAQPGQRPASRRDGSRQTHGNRILDGWHQQVTRVERVKLALERSGPKAQAMLLARFSDIQISMVGDILIAAVKEIALVYGASVVVGAALGFLIGGPVGAGAGAVAGAGAAPWILGFLGLKSLLEYFYDAVPEALELYQRGFKAAWNLPSSGRAWGRANAFQPDGSMEEATAQFASGHLLLITMILTAMVAYLTRGKGNKAKLLKEVRESPRFGPKVANWLEQNESRMAQHPELRRRLQSGTSQGGNSAPKPAPAPPPKPASRSATPAPAKPPAPAPVPTPAPKPPAPPPKPAASQQKKPEWLERIERGNQFNKDRASAYPHNEVYINKPDGSGYYRLDSYNPAKGEIVSRKYTQLGDVQENTALSYVKEVTDKYPPGAKIANVPSSGQLAGQKLAGQPVLEVPVQAKPIPQSVLDAADEAGVLIRDVNGKIYP